ncbi:lanthionine synthetase LanC family protein, partial [Streptomyces sp. T21Q-yed]
RYEEGERWLLARTAPPPTGTPLGLYDGLAGVAHVLDRLGHRQRALDLIERILAERWQNLSSDLHGGLAGLGLVLGELARTTGESELGDRAAEAADILVRRLAQPLADSPKRRRAGLLRGASGPALFLLRQYERTGEPLLLKAAEVALRRDLDCCMTHPTGSLEVDEGWRTLPYLGDGSAGIGMVLDDYLAQGADSEGEFERARAGILTAATSRFYVQPGLFQGRAGMILHLARTDTPGASKERLAEQIDGLGWFAMDYQGQLAFPGHQMMRLSMDLSTGTAGCLLALGAALDTPDTAHLPFLPPLGRPHIRGSAT